jgi:hypothetical protein
MREPVRPVRLDLRKIWLRGLDSNQDNQLQRLACYQLHYPGIVKEIVADNLGFCFGLRALCNRGAGSVCRSGINLLRF